MKAIAAAVLCVVAFGVGPAFGQADRPTPCESCGGRQSREAPRAGGQSHWLENLLFYEYFHGDNGAGLGASHQTGWTRVVATLIQLFGSLDAQRALGGGKRAAFRRGGTPS